MRPRKIRIGVKVQKAKDFKPVVLWQREKYWINQSTGGYFIVYKNDDGTFSHCFNEHLRHATMRVAILHYLAWEKRMHINNLKEYSKLRPREMHFRV